MARIGNGVHGEGGLGPRLEPHLVLHLDQLEPVQILKVKVHILLVSSLVNKACWNSRTGHVLSDSHHSQLQSGLIINKLAKHKFLS